MADETEFEPKQDPLSTGAPANENEARAAERQALEAQLAELKDKYLRAVAETENIRKRAERDVADARAYGISSFAREMLGVADNLTRATEALDQEARASAEGTLRALLDGVELTRRELHKTLEKHGVRRLDPLGEKFDPNFHQAMFEIPTADQPAGTIVQVVQPGYAIGDRVLRPAMVAVARAAPRPDAEEPEMERHADPGRR
jgi:molecular chaperone GrpE